MPTDPLTPQHFVQEWKGRGLTERASSQTHFNQLCRLLGVPAPYPRRSDDSLRRPSSGATTRDEPTPAVGG
jgi:hypothetical protein